MSIAELPQGWLRAVQREDALLPELNAADWVTPLS